jgi:N-acylneuraminate cytidylyltransferase
MLTYAILPARGGSKGIPNKNLSCVGGRSLIEISVTECLNSNEVDEVFVSTDSTKIAEEARKFGAHVITRPEHLAGDTASSESALLHSIDEIEAEGYSRPEAILFLQVTSPFTTSKDIDGACRHFVESSADSLFTGSLFVHFLWERTDDGMKAINHDYQERLRRQDISNCFAENGAFYLMKTEGFIKSKHRFFGKIEMFEMDAVKSHEIDDPCDLDIANIIERKIK